MEVKNFTSTLLDRGQATDVWLVTKLFGDWPEDINELFTFCDPMSSFKNPTHFGGVVEHISSDNTVRKVTVYTD